jgi:hypothetical protein
LQTGLVSFRAYRELPDGRIFKQQADICQPTDFNEAVTDYDAIVGPRGQLQEEQDEARAVAAPSLPEDPNFPADQPLGFNQMHQLLS